MIDQVWRVLGTEQFPATAVDYAALLAWMRRFGDLLRIGVEGTGAYGAGLARLLADQNVQVVEVDASTARTRRFQGESDSIDALHVAKPHDGPGQGRTPRGVLCMDTSHKGNTSTPGTLAL
ncbi:transposase [Actinomadura luteofluorescens]|uniref:Transposase n=1 Tax=Actinomadura luteofluorescens TaxID=46163 RepID=A0A7Y9JJV8_9ACTN|nr:transposase [Actinomadura luteofluorescens]NYD51625.1 transposase [Actinomadura luteofluorescens]